MSATGLATFDSTLQTTNIWLDELMKELGWNDRHKAYHALRVVLHALRDRLPVNEAVQLGAQLPILIRGIYYEGWRPVGKPVKEHTRDEFLTHVTDAFLFDVHADSKAIATAVLRVLTYHVSSGEIDDVKHALPVSIRQLCP
jgi:uncharacterized protein (DUF2267 family)